MQKKIESTAAASHHFDSTLPLFGIFSPPPYFFCGSCEGHLRDCHKTFNRLAIFTGVHNDPKGVVRLVNRPPARVGPQVPCTPPPCTPPPCTPPHSRSRSQAKSVTPKFSCQTATPMRKSGTYTPHGSPGLTRELGTPGKPGDTPSGPPETPPPTTRMAPTRDFACQTEPWSICLESTILREACIDGPCKVDRAWWHAVQHSHVSAKEREVVEE